VSTDYCTANGNKCNCVTSLSNLERVSDHAVNVANLAEELARKKVTFSEQASRELDICIEAIGEIAELTYKAIKDNDVQSATLVEPLEEVICALSKELKTRHIQRLQAGNCTLELGFIYNDCINNFERVAAHCSNLAVAVLDGSGATIETHDYLRSLKENNNEAYISQLDKWAKKYYDELYVLDS